MRLVSLWLASMVGVSSAVGCGSLTQATPTADGGAETTAADTGTGAGDGAVGDEGAGPTGSGGASADGTTATSEDAAGDTSSTVGGSMSDGTTGGGPLPPPESTDSTDSTGSTDAPTTETTDSGGSSGDGEPGAEDYEGCYEIGMTVACLAVPLCNWDDEDGVCEPAVDEDELCALWPNEIACEASGAECSWDDQSDPPCSGG